MPKNSDFEYKVDILNFLMQKVSRQSELYTRSYDFYKSIDKTGKFKTWYIDKIFPIDNWSLLNSWPIENNKNI